MRKLSIILLSLLLLGCQSQETVVSSIYPNDHKMWQKIFATETDINFPSAPKAAILPHHMIVGDELAKFYQSLSAKITPSIIVIIGPNHYENGDAQVQTCQTCAYQTLEGELQLAEDLITQITSDKIAETNDPAFPQEHSLHAHTPYIKHYFPQAKILPIMLKWDTTLETTKTLSDWLSQNLPADAFVIASVDFSHYIPAKIADFHDIAAYTTIKNFDLENIYDLEVDSRASLAVVLQFATSQNAQNAQRFKHTNNQDYRPKELLAETTSHQFFAFFEGEIKPEKTLTITAFGNIDDPTLSLSETDDWSKNPLLTELRGRENRFLTGPDFLVFNLPAETCTTKTQNHLTINFCRLKDLTKLPTSGDYTYLLYDFPPETSADQAITTAKKLTSTHDISIFIGRGLQESLPVTIENNKIVAPSLTTPLGISIGEHGIETFIH